MSGRRAGLGARQHHLALAQVAGESCRAQERIARLGIAPELLQQVATYRRQRRVIALLWFRRQGREMAAFGPLEALDQAPQLRWREITPVGEDLRLIARPRGWSL